MDCIKLNNNINECATTNPFRRWDEVGYILPYEDVTNVVFDGMTVKFDTIGTAFSVRDRRLNPFSGSGSEFVQGDMGSVSWTERVNFPALANSVDNSTIANAIANGGRVVVILKQVDYESDGKGKYQVFGIDGGLRIDTMPFDPYADAAWNVTLIAEKMSRPAVYLWDTDEAITDAKWSLITQYEYITGLSLADGSVTPQVVYLRVEPYKTCYVVLPDGTTLTSTGGVINTTWVGETGAIIIIVDKSSDFLSLSPSLELGSDYYGDLVIQNAVQIDMSACKNLSSVAAYSAEGLVGNICESITHVNMPQSPVYIEMSSCHAMVSVNLPFAVGVDMSDNISLTEISAPNATYIFCNRSLNISNINAPNATEIYAQDCALTAVAIAAQLAATVANISDLSTVIFDFSGGTNAAYSTWSAQAQADAQTIITAGGTVTYTA